MVHKSCAPRRLLVQELFDGFTVADSEALAASGYDRAALADDLLRSMLEQVLTVGFFHADPHPGNVFVLEGGTLGLIDFGAVGRLDPIQQKAMVDLMAALVRRDVELLRDGVERVAEMAETVPPERLERSFARLMADHLRPGGAVDPSILQDLVSTLSEFGIRLPGDLVVLSRALVTLDGTLGIISSGVSLVAATTGQLTARTTGSRGSQDGRARSSSRCSRISAGLDRLDRTLMLAGRGDLRVRSVVDEDSRRILRTLVNRGLLAVIGGVPDGIDHAVGDRRGGPWGGRQRRVVRDLRLRRPAGRRGAVPARGRRRGEGRHGMTERSEVHVTVVCSPRSGEPVTGAPRTIDRRSTPHDRMVHQ